MSMMSESMSMTSLKNGGQGRVILYALSRDLSRDQQPAQTGLPLVLAHRNNRDGQNVRNPRGALWICAPPDVTSLFHFH